ncbi:hypothetical protein LTS08_007439 [Lithohypha guttulata]|nr:hypothetical protein LTS08_007439 [Lithohypha guttulata]
MSDERSRVTRSQGPTQNEWEELRPIIERHYKHENKTENQVRRILLEEHGVPITTKMFKQHVRKWRLDKKFKRREMIFSLRKIQQRKTAGKATRITIRGELLTEMRLNYYFKRRPMTTAEQLETEANASTPSDLDYATPRDDTSTDDAATVIDSPAASPFTPQSPVSLDISSIIKSPSDQDLGATITDVVPYRAPSRNSPSDHSNPQRWSLHYTLSPQETFLRQLYEHVRLTTGGEIVKSHRRTKFDTSSILRASGWFDPFLNNAVEAERMGERDVANAIMKRCADVVAAEVEGYFPDMCVLEMVEIVHYLQLRRCQQLQLHFMYALYDSVTNRLGQFHPLVELLCSATKGYTCSISSTLIPTMLDFLDAHTKSDVSLNTLLPLFAFQELRSIDTMPRDLLMHAQQSSHQRCEHCTEAMDRSPFVSQAFRSWAHRQFISLLNDVWVEPDAQQSAFHAIRRSRVWRYIWKFPDMATRRQELQKMTFKQRFWAVAKICFELVTRSIERIFLNCHDELSAYDYVSSLVRQSRIGLEEDEIMPLWTDKGESSLFDMELHTPEQCEHATCGRVKRSLQYWVGEQLCCV